MSRRFPIGPASRLLRRFAKADGGNIAVLFGVLLVPLLSFVGAAVDYSRANKARTAMQAALDSAALMVSKENSAGTLTPAQLNQKAQQYFTALYTDTDASNIAVTANYSNSASAGATIVLTGSGKIDTQFMRVAGFPTMSFNTTSSTAWGVTRMRVAIALDVTGSMNSDGKLGAMKESAKKLIDTLKDMAKTSEDVYVSIIPFAEMVNVGTGNRNASWIDWTDWNATNGSCSRSQYTTKSSCESHNRTWTADNHDTWRGCVTDRDQPNDVTSAGPTNSSAEFPADQAGPSGSNACPAQLLPMTSVFTSAGTDTSTDTSTIKGKINSLVASGGTNQPIGMAWAWQSLRTGDPLNTPVKDSNYQYTDTIILLSDGLNTIDRWYGNGSNPSPQVDARQRLLCDNIRNPPTAGAKVPQIFTIQVNTDGDPESAVLKYCGDKFYPTTTTDGMAKAFQDIGIQLSKLRIAR